MKNEAPSTTPVVEAPEGVNEIGAQSLASVLDEARSYAGVLRDRAGRSPEGRHYAVAVTDLEKALAWAVYHRL